MVDPTPEFKKVMKFIQNSIGNVEPGLPVESQPPKSTQVNNSSAFPSSKQTTSTKKPSGQAVNDNTNRCQNCNKRVAAVTENNDTLQCQTCKNYWHGKCIEPKLKSDLIKRFSWDCSSCKVCKECETAEDEAKMIICEMCDQSVHIHCLTPKMESVPSHAWFCDDCIKCKHCTERLRSIRTLADGFWHQDGERLCQKCYDTYTKEGDECGLCKKSYEGDFVMCDTCGSWHCAPCSGFTEAQLQDIDNQTYICLKCGGKKN